MVNSSLLISLLIFTIIFIYQCESISLKTTNPSESNKHNNGYANQNSNGIGESGRHSKEESNIKQQQEEVEETDDDDDDEEVADESDTENGGGGGFEERNCTCTDGASCLCCIDLNLSFIDLGGPGCVKFAYMGNNDSMVVDMSYGERILHSKSMKRNTLEPVCMNIFSDLAQMCTRFSEMFPVENGIRGCVTIEPVLIGVSQGSYNVGCFNMDNPGLQPPPIIQTSSQGNSNNTISKPAIVEEESVESEEELAAAISQSAEEGIAWFNNILSSVFGEDSNNSEPLSDSSNNSTKIQTHNITHKA